jgi:hypothetical protein
MRGELYFANLDCRTEIYSIRMSYCEGKGNSCYNGWLKFERRKKEWAKVSSLAVVLKTVKSTKCVIFEVFTAV